MKLPDRASPAALPERRGPRSLVQTSRKIRTEAVTEAPDQAPSDPGKTAGSRQPAPSVGSGETLRDRVEKLVGILIATSHPARTLDLYPLLATPGAARLLLRSARGCSTDDSPEALRIIGLALSALERADVVLWGRTHLWSARLEARAARIEVLLAAGSHSRASVEVSDLLSNATAEIGARLRGDLHLLAAHVSLVLGELNAARSHLRRAGELYEPLEEPARSGRVHLHLGELDRARGDVSSAIDATLRAATLFKAERDPMALFCARHNLAVYSCDADQYVEARRHMDDSRRLIGRAGGLPAVLYSQWVEARICDGTGDLERAESLLTGVQEGFLSLGDSEAVCGVTLELVRLLLRRGRRSPARRAAARLVIRLRDGDASDELLDAAIHLATFRDSDPADRPRMLVDRFRSVLLRQRSLPQLAHLATPWRLH